VICIGLIEELVGLIGSGSIGGLPPLALMAFPFVLGLAVGFLIKRLLKIAVIAGVIIALVSYLGFLNLSLGSLRDLAIRYGPVTYQYAILLLGMLPLSIGLIIGLVIGFLFG
jgi:uncharacterized membrane protein (Fun14 family)